MMKCDSSSPHFYQNFLSNQYGYVVEVGEPSRFKSCQIQQSYFSSDLNQQRENLSSSPEKMDSRAALESILIVFISIVLFR